MFKLTFFHSLHDRKKIKKKHQFFVSEINLFKKQSGIDKENPDRQTDEIQNHHSDFKFNFHFFSPAEMASWLFGCPSGT